MSTPRFQLVPGARLAGDPGHGGVGWRLLGSNNRELGRCARPATDTDSALAAIDEVRRWALEGTAHVSHQASPGVWVWELHGDEGVVAVSGRGFRHERECRYNLDQFRAEAPMAPKSSGTGHELPWQRMAEPAWEATS